MRIVYDHQVSSLQDAGGASRYHYELARHLLQKPEVKVGLYLGLTANVYPFDSLTKLGAHVLRLQSPIKPGLLRYSCNEVLTGLSLLTSGKWDIYHPTLYRAMPLIRARAKVVTHYDCTQERFPDLFPNTGRIMRTKSRLFKDADMIICISIASQRDLLHFYDVDEKKTRVVHLGLSPLYHSGQSNKNTPIICERPYLLYVGARHTYKNFAAFLEAFAVKSLSSDYDLVVLGGGSLSDSELKQIETYGLVNVIKHIALVDDETLAKAYQYAHLFIYPSLSEGFGFPPLEAMSLGCPVLAARSSCIPEICGDVPYYFEPNDPSSLAVALVQVLKATDRKERIAAGLELASRYKWSNCANNTLKAYREL